MLRGKKVLLRPVTRSDLSHFFRWFNDPEVTQYVARYLPMTEMAEEKWIEEPRTSGAQNRAVLSIEAIEEEANKAIGELSLANINPKDHSATFGIVIGEKDYWGKGYGTEATRLIVNYGFEQLNLHRISSGVISFNEYSARLHRRVGFKEEGRQREAMFRNGKFHDHVLFGHLERRMEETVDELDA